MLLEQEKIKEMMSVVGTQGGVESIDKDSFGSGILHNQFQTPMVLLPCNQLVYYLIY